MRKIAALFLIAILSGCATDRIHEITQRRISDGVWEGTLEWEAFDAQNHKEVGVSDLLIASCEGVTRVWVNRGDRYEKLGEKYIVHSYPDTHLIYFLDSGPKEVDWTEIQTYTLLEITSEKAAVQWTRAVNNRDVEKEADNRYSFNQGTGQFQRISKNCDNRLVP